MSFDILCSQNAQGLWGGTGQKSTFIGIFHPKMKMLSSFIHLQVVPNLYEFSSAEHILLVRMWVIKQLLVPIDFHSKEKNTMEVNGFDQLYLHS